MKNNLFILENTLNPWPVKRLQVKDGKFEVFNSKGLHFMHLDSSSILPKIGKLW